jgi:DNA-binding Lrp family transcriptional regulator
MDANHEILSVVHTPTTITTTIRENTPGQIPVIKKKVEYKDRFWERYRDKFVEGVCKVLGGTKAAQIAELLTQNYSLLKKGKFYISQIKLAEELGVDQRSVSRYLKKLVDAGILEVKAGHIFNCNKYADRKPKQYGFGLKMKDLIWPRTISKVFSINIKKIQHDILEDYCSRETNERMMADVRYLYIAGFDTTEITDYCYNKQHYGSGNHRSWRDIFCIARRWEMIYDGRYKRKDYKDPYVMDKIKGYVDFV